MSDRMRAWFTVRERRRDYVRNPEEVLIHVIKHFTTVEGDMIEQEKLVVVALGRQRGIVDTAVLTVGSDAHTIVDTKQVFRWALTRKRPVSAIILLHNHPSGDSTPSAMDRIVTRRVRDAGDLLGIEVTDHIVVGANGEWSNIPCRQ